MARPKPRDDEGELWAVVDPLPPKVERRVQHPGRKRYPDRLVFQGILFVLNPGIAWERLFRNLCCYRHIVPSAGYSRARRVSTELPAQWTGDRRRRLLKS
ncbi:transposase [Streptomyces sp. 900116325]